MVSDKAREQAARILAVLARTYPRAETALVYQDAFQLLVAVVLSARTTDVQVNKVTPALFRRYPTAQTMALAGGADLEKLIAHVGLFRAKARHLIDLSAALDREHGGDVPGERAALEQLPGVGHKTASVVLGVLFGQPTLPVDTHVFRVTHRLGLAHAADPVRVEEELCLLVPPESRLAVHHRLIAHGRTVCPARSPRCGSCPLVSLCVYPAENREGAGG
ncbi:MAG TPA: endonuclease III [Spirochaetia bacterium]|nr:endonuclease III [Spirochaetia bacterium]